jgi:DNA repair exonuclease SbcCD ATPase subunit
MKIKIQKLRIDNFKGAKNQEIIFSNHTNILGQNRAGKTRNFDALLWLLFGKDSQNQTAFEIKPLDIHNNVIHNKDVEVQALISTGDNQIQLKKIYREKWTKKKGNPIAELTGHETIHFIDTMNVTKMEYESYIKQIIDIELFKLITSPTYFENLNWTKKRPLLFELGNKVNDSDIASGNKVFEELLIKLSGRDIELYKKQIAATKREIDKELNLIPSRIDEVHKSKPEQLDFNAIESTLKLNKEELIKLEDCIKDSVKAFETANLEVNEKKKELIKLEGEIDNVKETCSLKVGSNETLLSSNLKIKQEELKRYLEAKDNLILRLSNKTEEIRTESKKAEGMRGLWYTENEKEFSLNESDTICPTCKRELDNVEDKKEELKANFNRNKRKNLEEINKNGQRKKIEIEQLQEVKIQIERQIKDNKILIDNKSKEIYELSEKTNKPTVSIEDTLKENRLYQSLLKEIEAKKKEIPEVKEVDNSEIENKITELKILIRALQKQLDTKEQIQKADDRIIELGKERLDKAQQIADLESEIYTIEQFIKKKIGIIEDSVNSKFSFVKFKLYNQLINGGEEECCITLIDGVPYNSANYESKINAGLDIINAFSKHNNVYAPVFIDNRESTTNIIPMETQIINLIVKPGQKELLIENK